MVLVIYEVSRLAAGFKEEMSTEDSDHRKEIMRQAIDTEVECPMNLRELISESRKIEYNAAAPRIPPSRRSFPTVLSATRGT